MFQKDHPPVFERALLGSTGSEKTLLAGTVLGIRDGKQFIFTATAGMEAHSILAEDVIVPASGDQYALTYTHAAVIAPELIWDEGVTATQQKTALEALRVKGIHASEA
jgi:hypothetical protein